MRAGAQDLPGLPRFLLGSAEQTWEGMGEPVLGPGPHPCRPQGWRASLTVWPLCLRKLP